MSVIALDIGRSAIKGSVSNPKGTVSTFTIPTATCLAFGISDDAESARAAKETVRVGSTDYFIGDTAIAQGGSNATGGLSDDWIESPEHSALLIGAYRKAAAISGVKNPKLVVGLPTHLFKRQRDRLRELASLSLGLDANSIEVLPQPVAPYWEAILNSDGTPRMSARNESWAVIDIGFFTTDFMLMMNGRWIETVAGTCSGAHIASERLRKMLAEKGIDLDARDCETALSEKQIKNFNQTVNVEADVNEAVMILANEIVDTAKRLIDPYARKLDGVIVAGGGAEFMFQKINDLWPHAIKPQFPRMSISEGMRRFGKMMILHETAQNSKG